MKRRSFITSLAALSLSLQSAKSEIEQLEEDYCSASNALVKYREKRGLLPGVRVRCNYCNNPPKFGTIPPFGSAWYGNDHMSVPVLLDAGYLQPWNMSDLTIITPLP